MSFNLQTRVSNLEATVCYNPMRKDLDLNGYTIIGGGGGSQTLQQTLTYGNITGGRDIIQSSGDSLKSSHNSDLQLELSGNGTVFVEQNNYAGTSQPIMKLQSNDNTGNGTTLELYKNSATPANGDLIGEISFYGKTDAGFKTQYAVIEAQIDDVNNTNYASQMNFVLTANALPVVPLQITSSNIIPKAIGDSVNSQGTSGQVLSSTGTGLLWTSPTVNQQCFAMNNLNTISFASLGLANTANKITIGSNASITAQNGFTLDTINNRIVYTGASGRRFLVQTSASLTSSASTNIGIELRQNVNAISQCRSNLTTASLVDLMDFNVLQLNNGDYLEWFCAYTISGASFSSASSTPFTSTTKPFQISITQLLY